MAMWVSVSGGVKSTRFCSLAIDQPAGTVNLAPPGVRRGVSAATCSAADPALICCVDAAAANLLLAPDRQNEEITSVLRIVMLRMGARLRRRMGNSQRVYPRGGRLYTLESTVADGFRASSRTRRRAPKTIFLGFFLVMRATRRV